MFNTEDTVTLNGKQMNTIIEIMSNEADYLKLYFSEKICLEKVVKLNKELAEQKVLSNRYLRELRESNDNLTVLEKKVNDIYSQVENKRVREYEKG